MNDDKTQLHSHIFHGEQAVNHRDIESSYDRWRDANIHKWSVNREIIDCGNKGGIKSLIKIDLQKKKI